MQEAEDRSATLAHVAALWAEHRAATFPDGLRWLDAPSGESVTTLDVYMAGCISTYLSGRGILEPRQQLTLATCARELNAVLPLLTAHDAEYVNRLIKIAALIDP